MGNTRILRVCIFIAASLLAISQAWAMRLGDAINAAANGVYLEFQRSCDGGSRPLPGTIAFAGVQKHDPGISESDRRRLNDQIRNAVGARLLATEMDSLAQLQPFLSLDPKGASEFKRAREAIQNSPLAVMVNLARPLLDTLLIEVTFFDRRSGCEKSLRHSYFVNLPALEIESRMSLGVDHRIQVLAGAYYNALAQFARELERVEQARAPLQTLLQFEFAGECGLRREALPEFDGTYLALRREVRDIVQDKHILPKLADRDIGRTPENNTLIRLRLEPSSISKQVVRATIELVSDGSKQDAFSANVVVEADYLAGCSSKQSPQVAPLPQPAPLPAQPVLSTTQPAPSPTPPTASVKPKDPLTTYVPSESGDFAPSFPCRYARQASEQAICGNRQLSGLDVELAQIYALVTGRMSKQQSEGVRSTQRQWLQQRDACGSDTYCLEALYRSRIRQLRGLLG